MEQKKNVMQNICSQTAALFEMRFYCDACQSTIWEMNRSVISSEIVSACGCLSLCACSPVHVSNTFFFGNAGGDLGAVNCYDLTSHENDVELLMIASQKGNSSPVQFSEMNKHESLIQLSLFTCYCWSCKLFLWWSSCSTQNDSFVPRYCVVGTVCYHVLRSDISCFFCLLWGFTD